MSSSYERKDSTFNLTPQMWLEWIEQCFLEINPNEFPWNKINASEKKKKLTECINFLCINGTVTSAYLRKHTTLSLRYEYFYEKIRKNIEVVLPRLKILSEDTRKNKRK